jgi:transcriptional regulator with XRE-family HTH domain
VLVVLGTILKDARQRLRDSVTGRERSVAEMARQLQVTPSFVYQVEKGIRKPKDGDIGVWASVYGVRYKELMKCLNRIPFNFVATLKEEAPPTVGDPFSQLTEYEKSQLQPFLDYIRWKAGRETRISHGMGTR